MPGFNQKGPMGQGSMTGRRMGKCTGFGAQNQEQPTTVNKNEMTQGRGMGRRGRNGGNCEGRGANGRGRGGRQFGQNGV